MFYSIIVVGWAHLMGVGWAGPALDDAKSAATAAASAGDAVAEYAACVDVLSLATPQQTGPCRRRMAWIDARRDHDGQLDGLQALNGVRRAYARTPADERWTRVASVADAPGCAELLRDEATLWLAREALDRRQDPALALSRTQPLWDRVGDGGAVSGLVRVELGDLHARALLATGDAAGARAVEAAVQPTRSARAASGLPVALRRARRPTLWWASVVGFGGFLVGATPFAWRTARRASRPRPGGLVPLLVVALGAAGLAVLWDPSVWSGMAALVAGLSVVHVLSAFALVGARGRAGLLLRVGAAVATLSVAFLVLHRFGLLDGVGL